MPLVRLNQRIYGPYSLEGLKTVGKILGSMLRGLKVDLSQIYTVLGGWVNVFIGGLDVEVALSLLAQRVGFLPKSLSDVSRGSLLKCRILAFRESGLYVDTGLKGLTARVPMNVLKSQTLDVGDVGRFYMLHREFPVELYVERVENGLAECRLSWRWLNWVEGIATLGFTRVYIAGVTPDLVRKSLGLKQFRRAVLDVIPLGALEHLILVDPLINPERFSSALGKTVEPSILEFSKPPKSFGKFAYTLQDKIRFNPPPPFQIPYG